MSKTKAELEQDIGRLKEYITQLESDDLRIQVERIRQASNSLEHLLKNKDYIVETVDTLCSKISKKLSDFDSISARIASNGSNASKQHNDTIKTIIE